MTQPGGAEGKLSDLGPIGRGEGEDRLRGSGPALVGGQGPSIPCAALRQ